MYWLLGRKSRLSIENKLLLYKAIPKVILWRSTMDTVSNSNIEIIVNALRYITNDTLHRDLNMPYIRDEIKILSKRYADRMEEHPNILATNFMEKVETRHRLKRKLLVYLIVL